LLISVREVPNVFFRQAAVNSKSSGEKI